MVGGPASEGSAQSRDALSSLVEAVADPGMGATVLGWWNEAKVAQNELLQRAHFAGDNAAEEQAAGCCRFALN